MSMNASKKAKLPVDVQPAKAFYETNYVQRLNAELRARTEALRIADEAVERYIGIKREQQRELDSVPKRLRDQWCQGALAGTFGGGLLGAALAHYLV